MRGLSARERDEVRQTQNQANEQLTLLGRATNRVTLTSTPTGILPRKISSRLQLPASSLYAYVPAVGSGGPRAAFLQRARFLGISEFGPGV